MFRNRLLLVSVMLTLLSVLLGACTTTPAPPVSNAGSGTPTAAVSLSFPSTPPQLRTPTFVNGEQGAPSVKVLASVAPTLIVQFPLFPVSIKQKFPDATGLVTITQNPQANDFDSVTVDVLHMPPGIKFTVFFTEISSKPFGHAEYVGDVLTRGDGSGESTFHLIAFVAFAADNRHPGTSQDQSGSASGIQLEHAGMWFDTIEDARHTLGDSTIATTPFDGGPPAKHSGPQVLTDGQTLPVI